MAWLPKSEESFWREFSPGHIYPELPGEMTVDVSIVGGGITGLTAAFLLKQRGLSVAVLEKDTVGGGTSGRTTGKVTSQHGLTYAGLQEHLGGQAARIYGEANQAALEMIETTIRSQKISCDWQRDDNYVFTTDPAQISSFKREAEAAARLGLPASFATITPLPFEVKAAVKFSDQGKINSQKYLSGLAAAVNSGGSYVFEHSPVTGIHDGAPCLIQTNNGHIFCKHIIVATNVPTLPLVARVGYCIYEYPLETSIIAGRLEQPLKGMYISPDSRHYSILPIKVEDESYVMIAGEGGNLPGFRLGKKSRHQRLADYAGERLGVTEITNRWSDRDYLAYDDMPMAGKLYAWSKHLYVATAYRKWGLTNGTASAMILCDLITGQPNPWAEYFAPNQFRRVRAIPRTVSHLAKG